MSRNVDAKAPSRGPTRTCFIGNLPWDITEPQLKEVFAEIGPVKFFRLVTDRDTGKPKGFAFCEYFDVATAAAAQRNLNNHDMSGRHIHVDFAEDKDNSNKDRPMRDGSGGRGGGRMPLQHAQMQPPRPTEPHMQPIGGLAAGQAEAALGVLVDGPAAAATAPADHNVTAVLAGMTRRQLYDILSQMKALLQQNPVQARQIMVNNPQLTKALFQAQITMGMVPLPEDMQMHQPQPPPQDVNGGFGRPPPQQQQQPQPFNPGALPHQTPPYAGGGDPAFAPPHGHHNQPQQPQQQQQPMQQPYGYSGGGGGPPPQASLPQQQPQQQGQVAFLKQEGPQFGNASPYAHHPVQSDGPDPSLQQGQMSYAQEPPLGSNASPGLAGDSRMQGFGYGDGTSPYSPSQQHAPPAQQQQQQAPMESAKPSALEDQQKALLEQVMSLTQQQIDLLPPQQKAQVLALQQHSRALGSRP